MSAKKRAVICARCGLFLDWEPPAGETLSWLETLIGWMLLPVFWLCLPFFRMFGPVKCKGRSSILSGDYPCGSTTFRVIDLPE